MPLQRKFPKFFLQGDNRTLLPGLHTFSASLPEPIVERISGTNRRTLLYGESGIGKSRLAATLASVLTGLGHICHCIGADPGSPSFGMPGAVCLGSWQQDHWRLKATEALCSLDAGRFRLPLIMAVRRLAFEVKKGILLLDSPGVVRSVAGAELLTGLVEAAAVDTVLVLVRDIVNSPMAHELATIACNVLFVQPSAEARPPSKGQRTRQRTRLWDAYLRRAEIRTIAITETHPTGTPPPLTAPHAWQGRQIALLQEGRTLGMGEILDVTQNTLRLRIAAVRETADQFLVRDCFRNERGQLATIKPADSYKSIPIPPTDIAYYAATDKSNGHGPPVSFGEAKALLVNGIFGDPLLHLRLQNRKRSLLFDLGEGGRLPARLAHQVSDVFISHAHIDHICGFLWLLRSRIGLLKPCRLYGPAGLADHIEHLINGIHWDRIGEKGPGFEVGELHDDHLLVFKLRAGGTEKIKQEKRFVGDGLLVDDADCRVQAVSLMHGGIPSLAYRLELKPKFNVMEDRLRERNLPPGPWLGELKRRLSAGELRAKITLPDGSEATAGSLADTLIRITPPATLVYATDLSDIEKNRKQLVTLARGAKVFFCEAAFLEAERQYATLSGHLTARACGEIAREAGVNQVIPFHFSRRYEKIPRQMFDEVSEAWGGGRMVQ